MAASDKKTIGQIWEELREGRVESDPADVQFLAGLQQELSTHRGGIPVRGQDAVWAKVVAKMDATDTSAAEARIIPLHRRPVWIAAAAVLIASLMVVLSYNVMVSQQQLLSGGHDTVTSLSLDDGSVVTLRPGASLFVLGRPAATEQRYRLEGEALFEVVSNQNRVFRVETATGSVQVLGTEFLVRSTTEGMEVYLLEGRVEVADRAATRGTQLQPGQAVRVDANGLQELAGVTWQDYALGWTTGQLITNGRSVEEVVGELEFHFGVQIRVPAGLGEETLGGTLTLESIDLALGDLGAALGGSFREVQDGVYEMTAP